MSDTSDEDDDDGIPSSPDALLTDAQLAKIFGVHRKFFPKMRISGDGPIFIKVGRLVRYKWADVETWRDKNRRNSTSDPGEDDK